MPADGRYIAASDDHLVCCTPNAAQSAPLRAAFGGGASVSLEASPDRVDQIDVAACGLVNLKLSGVSASVTHPRPWMVCGPTSGSDAQQVALEWHRCC